MRVSSEYEVAVEKQKKKMKERGNKRETKRQKCSPERKDACPVHQPRLYGHLVSLRHMAIMHSYDGWRYPVFTYLWPWQRKYFLPFTAAIPQTFLDTWPTKEMSANVSSDSLTLVLDIRGKQSTCTRPCNYEFIQFARSHT